MVLDSSEDPELERYLLSNRRYRNHPLAQLYPLYWDKGDHHLEQPPRFIPVPLGIFPSGKLYVFGQYTYTKLRIDTFREKRVDAEVPPGLALIGSPGIGELFRYPPVHIG